MNMDMDKQMKRLTIAFIIALILVLMLACRTSFEQQRIKASRLPSITAMSITTITAAIKFTPRDYAPLPEPLDGVGDVIVGAPGSQDYAFIKQGQWPDIGAYETQGTSEDRGCIEFDLATLPPTFIQATLELLIWTLDDGVDPAEQIEIAAYQGNATADIEDFDPPTKYLIQVFSGPSENEPPGGSPCTGLNFFRIDVGDALGYARTQGWSHIGFVFRTIGPTQRFNISQPLCPGEEPKLVIQ